MQTVEGLECWIDKLERYSEGNKELFIAFQQTTDTIIDINV